MRTTNHFQASQHISLNDDNQFLLAPSRLTYTNQKDQLIKKLQQKNKRLMTEIQKIQKVLQQPQHKTIYGNRLPDINSKATQQQLQNAYKQIRNYQYQVKKSKGINQNGTYVQQIKKYQAILKQKEDMAQRLKKQLAGIKKQSNQLVKNLKNDNIKQQYEVKHTKLNAEIKFLQQKLKQAQMKKNMNNANRQKQLVFIKNLQKNLIQKGYPLGDLRILRQKFSPSKQTINNTIYNDSGRRNTARPYTKTSYQQYQSQKQQIIEDRTLQAFTNLKNQIKLLQKMEKDYQNQMNFLDKQKIQAMTINSKSRDKLIQIQDQIQKVQKRINQLKKMIDPLKIKPTRGISMPNSTKYGVSSALTPGKSVFNHLFKAEEVGKLSKEGKRFTDRIKLGKAESKITSIDYYENTEGPSNVVGLQVTYQIKNNIKKGALNMIHDVKLTNKKTFTLFDSQDYFKQIECITNDKNMIIGICMISKKGVPARAGCVQGIRKPLNIGQNEYPVSLFGSFTTMGIQLFGAQVVQQKQN